MSPCAGGRRILYVEGHLDTVAVVSRILRRAGCDVTVAHTLGEAHLLCQLKQFDIFLCEVALPDGEGWDLPALARRCGARAIALTVMGMPDDVARIRSAGFESHLLKPVPLDQLLEAIGVDADDEPEPPPGAGDNPSPPDVFPA